VFECKAADFLDRAASSLFASTVTSTRAPSLRVYLFSLVIFRLPGTFVGLISLKSGVATVR
jgi:hypothetical protein